MYFGSCIILCEYRNIEYNYNIEIVGLEIPENHIHMVVRSDPKVSPSDIMQMVQSLAALELLSIIWRLKNNIF